MSWSLSWGEKNGAAQQQNCVWRSLQLQWVMLLAFRLILLRSTCGKSSWSSSRMPRSLPNPETFGKKPWESENKGVCSPGPRGRAKCLCCICVCGCSTLDDPFHGTLSCISAHCHHSQQYPKYDIGIFEHRVILISDINARKGTLCT